MILFGMSLAKYLITKIASGSIYVMNWFYLDLSSEMHVADGKYNAVYGLRYR